MNDSCSRGFAISVDETQLASPALPSEDPSIQDVDLLLARSLNQLPIKEREEVLHDIHGVSDIPEEEPKNTNTLLNALDSVPLLLLSIAF